MRALIRDQAVPLHPASHLNHIKVVELPPEKRFIWGPSSDFWTLGGASIFLWGLLLVADIYRGDNVAVNQRFGQIAVVFSFLSLFVNYPHFMISYRFGYGRGRGFILKNWIALLAVPLGMIGALALAYFAFSYDVSANQYLLSLDASLHHVGLDLGIPYRGALGLEILSALVWLMYFTVGWHYSKQVFGAMMVCAKLRGYAFTRMDRLGIKANLFSVVIYQFLYMNRLLAAAGASADPRFPGVSLTGFELPSWIYSVSTATLALSTFLVGCILFDLFARRRHRPDASFLVCWVSFLIWWIPIKNLPEFYLMAVPFFHSLQYLLFAAKMEGASQKSPSTFKTSIVVIFITLAGVAGFELIPSSLDLYLATSINQSAWFFMGATAIFINVHHFFIDSVVWKFEQAEMKRAFFG
jgi:hypothetical protein